MKPFREHYLHLAEKFAKPCCLSSSAYYVRDTPTYLGKVVLQLVHLIFNSHIVSLGAEISLMFYVLAEKFRLNIGMQKRYDYNTTIYNKFPK